MKLKDLLVEVDGEKVALGELVKTATADELREMGIVDEKGFINTEKLPMAAKNDEALNEEKVAEAANFIKALVLPPSKHEQHGVKAIDTGSGSFGSTVPTTLADKILEKKDAESVLRGRAFSFSFSGKFQLPKESVSVTAYWVAENASVTESAPTTGSLTLDDHYLAARVLAPWKLMDTSAVGIVNYISAIAGRALAQKEEEAFIAGSGSAQPTGLRSASISSIAQSGAALAYSDLVDLYFELPVQYRKNAVFIGSTGAVKKTVSLEDSNSRPLFPAGQPLDRLFGKELLETGNIPENLGTGSNETEMYIGDPFYYWIKDGQNLEMKTDEILSNMQTEILVYQAVDGNVALEDAWRKLTGVK